MALRPSPRKRPGNAAGNSSQPPRASHPSFNTPSRKQMRRNSQRRSSGGFNPNTYERNSYGSQGNRRGAPSREYREFQPPTPANQYSRHANQYSRRKQGMSRGKKIGIGALVVLLVMVVGAGTAVALYMGDINAKLSGNKTVQEQKAIKDVTIPVKNFTDPFYMMLIGSDKRVNNDEDGQRSDTNILVRVDPTTSIVTMVSIPRDTEIEIDGQGTNKFNAAYNYGGVAATVKEASQLCGVGISHYAEINFEELINLVDAVGGVEVKVPEIIDDPDAGDIVIQPGLQVLDGKSALVFARSRAYVDGDFTRTSNQRLLIEALVNKILALPVTEIPGVIQNAAKCVTTDLAVNDILSLAMQFKEAGAMTMYSAMVPSTTADIKGVSYVIADQALLKKMMGVVDSGGDPSTVIPAVGSAIAATSSVQGAAALEHGSSASSVEPIYAEEPVYAEEPA
ncbi:MAG: LCP family protein [Raoultibacter sp.]